MEKEMSMEDFVKGVAASEGWTDATTAQVLAGVLQDLVDMGAADADDLHALVRRRGHVSTPDEDEGPEEGDVVLMHGQDVTIHVEEIPEEQPDSSEGIWTVVDQYGETHRIERESVDDPWYVVIPSL